MLLMVQNNAKGASGRCCGNCGRHCGGKRRLWLLWNDRAAALLARDPAASSEAGGPVRLAEMP